MKKITILFVLIFCLLAINSLESKSIKIFSNNINKYPEVKTQIMPFGNGNYPIQNLSIADFKIVDNSSNRIIKDYQNEQSNIDSKVSLLILFDLNLNNYNGNFQLAKNIVSQLLKSYDFNNGECGLISYDLNAYFNAYFTNDILKLNKSLDQLYPYIASDNNAGFFGEPLGAFKNMKEAKFNKNVLLITDGYGKTNSQLIIDSAKSNGVKISVLNIQRELTSELKRITEETNGYFLDKISINDDISLMCKTIVSLIYGYKPSTLIWQGDLNCDNVHNIDLSILKDTIQNKFNFQVPDTLKPRLEFDPPYLRYSSVLPLSSKEIKVDIKAKNGNITLYNLKIEDANNGIFGFTSGSISNSIVIPKDSVHSFILKYSPIDSAIVFTRILVESNGCFGNEILVTGGFPNTPPTTKTIKMVSPNLCDEVLVGSEYYNVTWAGLLPKDVIQLEYSLNNGNKWDTLATNVTGLEHQWLVPKIKTDKGLVRIIQLWPNNVGRTLNFPHPIKFGFDSRYEVNNSFFSQDGTKILTSCTDKIVRTWNANNGTLEFELVGHTDEVNYAVFSPDGQYIASSSMDKSFIIWNAFTGKLLKKVNVGFNVWSVNFSPDASKIITTSSDGKFRIFDSAGNILYTSLKINTGYQCYGMFTPKGKYALVTGGKINEEIRKFDIQDIKNPFQVSVFSNKGSSINYFDISPDEKKIAMSETSPEQVSIWNVDSVKKQFNVIQFNQERIRSKINKVSFAYNATDTTFITAGFDERAMQWDARTGDSIRQFKEHTGNVTSAVANFDMSRVLTSSWDGLAKIWNLNEKDLQVDTSDCTFKIGIAKASIKSIDFGDVVLNFEKDTVIKDMILNLSDFPYQVKSISIIGANKDDFKLLSSETRFVLDSSSMKEVEIAFNPFTLGLKEAKLKLVIPGDTLYANLRGTSVSPSIILNEKYVDFTEVELGDYKDKSASYLIKNNTSNVINLDSVFVSIPNTTFFRLTNIKNRIVKPNEGAELSLRFNPQTIGNQNSTAIFKFNGNNSPIKIPMIGKGVPSSIDTATLKIDPILGKPGDYVNLDFKLVKNSNQNFKNSFTGFKTYLKFNSTLLQPVNGFVSNFVNGKERTIELDLKIPDSKLNQIQTNEEILIGSVKFKVGLGNDTISELKIINSQPIGYSKVLINETSSFFKLEGICKDGDVRLFNDSGKLYLDQNYPNPSINNTTIKYEIIEKGNTSLKIYDNTGKIVKILFNESKPAGAYVYSLDTSNFPVGFYFYILNTPTQELSRILEIRK
ncbi:MAG: T9SS type A sorting domain-containing protein [Candidatus Kapabacteria bacterium]|nr:T9SS type A sorting domain-containing protein [Candidatus Kapabacteria bacterium]